MATDAGTPGQQDPESFQQMSVTGRGTTSPSATEEAHGGGIKSRACDRQMWVREEKTLKETNVEMEWLRLGGCVLKTMETTDETAAHR